jgi:DnaJ-class molecular chaperone
MVDQLLGGLFGGQDQDDEPTRRGRARDYVDRYERGAFDQMSDDEVLHNYRTAAIQLSPDDYEQTAREAFKRMSPEERRELRRYMRERSSDRFDAADDSPEELARAMRRADDQDQGIGGGLASLFGFGGDGGERRPQEQSGGMLDNPLAKAALAGVAAMAAKRFLSNQ